MAISPEGVNEIIDVHGFEIEVYSLTRHGFVPYSSSPK
jgi:hypothetical protein